MLAHAVFFVEKVGEEGMKTSTVGFHVSDQR